MLIVAIIQTYIRGVNAIIKAICMSFAPAWPTHPAVLKRSTMQVYYT